MKDRPFVKNETKPDCYKCRYRGNLAGDVHSCCYYPGNDVDFLTGFFSEQNSRNATALRIKADVHGVKNGWFIWPVNFDPVWLQHCEGFTPKDPEPPQAA